MLESKSSALPLGYSPLWWKCLIVIIANRFNFNKAHNTLVHSYITLSIKVRQLPGTGWKSRTSTSSFGDCCSTYWTNPVREGIPNPLFVNKLRRIWTVPSMAGIEGLEPTTLWLTATCSTDWAIFPRRKCLNTSRTRPTSRQASKHTLRLHRVVRQQNPPLSSVVGHNKVNYQTFATLKQIILNIKFLKQIIGQFVLFGFTQD